MTGLNDIAHTYAFYLLPQPDNFTLPSWDAGRGYNPVSVYARMNLSVGAMFVEVGAPIAADYFPFVGYIGEKIHSEWVRCESMGASKPNPDFAVRLQRSAFEAGEQGKLENYATPQGLLLFTPNLCLPFLVCEAKTGQVRIDKADTQNIHSASIAVRAILRLYNAAYGRDHERTQALLGHILVFSVPHGNHVVNLYGRYAIASGNNDKLDGTAEELE
ncbi:hypothetical protein B0A54_17690 [Friedmanniomyces endolithicus]|uniref:DUF7924 domain-containing protein n=1 Tax=Friedmanniomyces endolithicus TaxID=329885 RepID=A0A4U0TTT6_9PEZI|nr:hypothetical protein B0A54_17690 [Friedmanniomyces endolithicus]